MSSLLPHSGQRVLIVDRSADNREVLRTILARSGVTIFEASRGDDGLDLLARLQPDVVIVDGDTVGAGSRQVREELDRALADETSIVVLGAKGTFVRGEAVGKPYQYGPLIRKIEELLNTPDEAT